MRKPQIFNKLAKSRGARALAAIAVFLLAMQPFAFALDQVVNKYASDYYVQPQDIGNAHPLDVGSVFNFNNSKAASVICLKPGEPGYPDPTCTPGVDDVISLSEVDESNCDPESTEFTYDMGDEGWEGTPGNSFLKYLYDATNYAIEANLTKKNQTAPFTFSKKFFYECGAPGMSDFKIRYQVRAATGINTTNGTNYFKVELVKPLGGIIELVPQTNFNGIVSWTWKPGPADTNTTTIATSNWNESGVYTLRISGQLRTGNTGTGHLVAIQFDDVSLRKTSLWSDYRHDVEYFVKAAPYSQLGGAGGGYTLQVKAAKKTSGADDVNVLVFNGASWTSKGQITQAYNDTLPQNNLQVLSIPLSDAEYNNGLVRVRYVDATQSGDSTPGGLYIDYQRINVDQGVCVQEVRSIEADCGKCHNYNGDVTKPWPAQGMHNKHAQTESVSDCAWCHPDVTVGGTVFPSDHMNGVQDGRNIELAGTKIYRLGGANPQGATGVWDPATGQCTNSDCHNNILTPSWTASYSPTGPYSKDVIARNCARCHNNGTNPGDNGSDENIAYSWPATLAHGEHDTAFNMDENSCQGNGSCHPDNRGQHTPVKDVDGVVTKMSPKYQSPSGSGVKYIKDTSAVGDGRCYNATCHGGQETPKWNAAVGSLDPTQGNAYCKACHKGEKATTWTPGAVLPDISAKQYNSPISGLHQGSPPTSGKSHVSEYGCAVCHTSNPTYHFKDGTGTTNLDSWQMDTVTSAELVTTMGYAAGTGTSPSYSDGTPPTCATPYPGPGGLTCHAESDSVSAVGKLGGTNTPWNRDWSWDAYSSNPADQCKVCHGVYGSFKNLRPAHNSTKLAGNHSDNGINCATTCHAQTDNETTITPSIYNHGVTMTADAKTIDVNMNVGFTQYPSAMETGTTGTTYTPQVYYNQTGTTDSVGCNGCHNNGQTEPRFSMQESGWKLRNQLTGPGVSCTNCHGDAASKRYWPDTAGADDGATTVDIIGAHELHMAWLANKVYSQDIATLLTDTGGTTDTKQKALCQYCHQVADGDHGSATTADVFPSATYAKRIQDGASDTGTLAAFETTGNTCSNVDCHAQYGTVAAGSEAVTTPNWYITPTHTFATTTMNCSACHNNPSSDTAGKHTVHTGTSFGVSITCASCHGASVAWGSPTGTPPPAFTSHLNGTFALASALTNPPVYAGTFRTSFGGCGTANYCHRSDASANSNAAVSVTWGTAQAGSCNFCHLEAMTSNKHSQHLGSNSLPGTAINECYVCHNSTATSGGLATGANHINGADDLNFNSTFANYEASTAARAAGTGSTTTCSNTKCHNGVTTPAWSGTVSCGSCHNTSGTGPLPSAASVVGKHNKHANNDATYTDCAQCHPNAVSYTATGGHADHQNLAINLTIAGITYADTANTAGGVNFNAAGATHIDDGTCSNTNGCHGTTGSQGWAAASTLTNGCFACHGGGLSATETGTTKPAVDAIPNPVNNTQYTSQGHGNTTTFPGSGTAGPGSTFLYTGTPGCYNCHDSNSTHTPAASATDPFRLGANAGNTNAVCTTVCHTSTNIKTHSEAIVAMGSDWPPATGDYDFKCVDCHDPHGDGNYYMIRSHISAPTASNDTTFGSDSYGTPQDTGAISAVTFTSLTGMAAGSFGISGTGNGICEVCHTQTTYYIRGSATVDTHNTSGNCTTSCHTHSSGFKASSSCDGCHKPGGSGPTVVYPTGTGAPAGSATVYGSHLKATRAQTLSGSTNWETQCQMCHPYHTGGVPIPSKTGFFTYTIHLGGTSTSGTTEAEICWNCHKTASPIVSEFGTNTNGTYNYGSLHTTSGDATASPGNEVNWVTGYWKSALFSYKNGPLKNRPNRTGADPGVTDGGSVHATGGTVGTQDETLGNIRCSYCHDVHDTQGTGAGKPYLRGTWRTSPYKEDGAPRAGVTFAPAINVYGPVPRGATSTTGNGGYQIDQNNGDPNTTYAYATNDGLCNLCHTQTAIQTAWVGHNNSVRGFTNDTSTARNIFKTSIRGTQNNRTVRPHMAYQGVTQYYTSSYMGGLRASDTGTGTLTAPKVNGKIYGYQAAKFPWVGVSVDDTTVNADYHSFSCSKCHTPHASRLPRLMITNCLDTRLNTWDDQYTSDANWANWTMTNLTDATAKKNLAYASTAQNCHRRIDANADGDAADVGEEPGWNTVTPW